MNKIIIATQHNSPFIPFARHLSKTYKKSYAVQDYNKAINLLNKYPCPLYDQLVSDGPGYNLEDSMEENIYANYDVVVVNILTLNIICEALVNDFNVILLDDKASDAFKRGTRTYAIQNFEHSYFINDSDLNMVSTPSGAGTHTEVLWSKND